MRKLTEEELIARLNSCPGWHDIAREMLTVANEQEIPLRTVAFQRKRGLRPIYPRRFVTPEMEGALAAIAEKAQTCCWQCGCETETACMCEECCNVATMV